VNYCRLVHYRWVNNNDIVTRVPPTWWGYRHGGREMYIDYRGRVRDVKGWRRVFDRLRGFLLGLIRLRIDQFSDHSIENYITHIHAAVQRQQKAMTPHIRRRSPTTGHVTRRDRRGVDVRKAS
jgi:triacylglycerol lipase